MLYENYDYQQWPKLSVRHWKKSQINLIRKHIYLALQESILMPGTDLSRPRLSRNKCKQNKHLFKLFSIAGGFEFHSTNNGYTLYVSQIMAYINGNRRTGGLYLYIKGEVCKMNEMEVHHYNNVTTDNSSTNLCYVTPRENKLLHHIVEVAKQSLTKLISTFSSVLANSDNKFKSAVSRTLQSNFANQSHTWLLY